jgi:hypothetical protein
MGAGIQKLLEAVQIAVPGGVGKLNELSILEDFLGGGHCGSFRGTGGQQPGQQGQEYAGCGPADEDIHGNYLISIGPM